MGGMLDFHPLAVKLHGIDLSKNLIKSSAIVSGMTLISRFAGYFRDVIIAITFGASGATDAFFVAFRIPNLLRRMFAEGAFAQAFVPVFTEYKEQRSKQDAKDLVDHVCGQLGVILVIITAIGILAAPLIISLFAPGFNDEPARHDLATLMLRLTFPYVLFISLTALAAGILNSYGKFAIPAFTPVFLNLSLIAVTLWLAPRMEEPVIALAWGVFFGGIVQLLFQMPALHRLGLLPRPRLKRGHKGVKKIMVLMAPALFGSSVAQINLLINTIIASFLVAGSISWLYFSDRFVELPLALFGIAIATVILPKLSAQHASKSAEDFDRTLDWALRLGVLIAFPAMIGLILLAGPILATLLQYNAFTSHDTLMTSISMATFSIGLPAFILIKLLAPGFFARQNTKTPVKIGLIAIAANMLFNLLIVVPWVLIDGPAPHAALALSAALAAYINAGLLYRGLRKEGVYNPQKGWGKLTLQMTIALIFMTASIVLLSPPLEQWQAWGGATRGLNLAGVLLAAVISYLGVLLLVGIKPRELLRG